MKLFRTRLSLRFVETGRQVESFFDDGHEHLDGDSDPDLSFDGVFGGAEECFDTKMLFNPLEEQLNSPAQAVELGNGERGQEKVVGKKDQVFSSFEIFELHSSQRRIEPFARIEDGEHDGLVADQAGAFVDFAGVAALNFEIGLGTRDEETAGTAQSKKALEIDIAAIHHVEGARFGNQLVEQVDVVPFAVADMNEGRDIAPQVQERMQLDSRFGRTKRCPRKHRQTQIDGGGVESVNRVFQIDSKGLVGIQPSCHRDQPLGKVAVDAPVASCVGVGKSVARHGAADAQVVELGGLRAQTGFDISETLAKRQLRKSHRQVLIQASEPLHLVMSTITRHTATEVVSGRCSINCANTSLPVCIDHPREQIPRRVTN
jgi:hypothetical protein